MEVFQAKKNRTWSDFRKGDDKTMMKKIGNVLRRCVPLWSAILLGVFGVSLIVNGIIKQNTAFAEAVHTTIGAGIRAVLAALTSWIPISLAEFLLISSPIWVVLLVVAIVRRVNRSHWEGIRFCAGVLSLVSLVYSVSTFGYEGGFYGKSIEEKLNLEPQELSAEQLYETSVILLNEIKEDLPYVSFPRGTYSAMTFSYAEMNDKLNAAYDKLCDTYPAFQRLHANTKPVMLSEPWTYAHISGLYTFFTGEANVNTNYPDYIVISSAAHEMAHQRGINHEDEANFVAYLVCSMSDDPYIRYCGKLDALKEVAGKLAGASPELYQKYVAQVPEEIRNENTWYGEFFDKYRKTVVSEVSTTVNNAFITSNNQPAGVKSYGLVVDLVAAYVLGRD